MGLGLQPGAPSSVAPVVDGPEQQPARHVTSVATAARSDDPEVTLAAFFGPQDDTTDRFPPIASDRRWRSAALPVESVIPQLKLLVRNHLQRSSAPVDELIDSAADDRRNVEWLADRVRAMTVRGFQRSTFDHLADEMLELMGGEPV